MSKKNKRKFNTHQPFHATVQTVSTTAQHSPASVPSTETLADTHTAEYKVIKHDLIKVLIINALFLAGVLTLYYTNLQSGYLEKWFGSFLKF